MGISEHLHGKLEALIDRLLGSATAVDASGATVTLAKYGKTQVVAVTPTITAGAYSAKDFVGGKLTFTLNGASGVIHRVTISDKSVQRASLELHLYTGLPNSVVTNNGPCTVNDADLGQFIGHVPIDSGVYTSQYADNSVATVPNVGLPFSAPTRVIDGFLVCVGTPTYASTSDLTVKLGLLLD